MIHFKIKSEGEPRDEKPEAECTEAISSASIGKWGGIISTLGGVMRVATIRRVGAHRRWGAEGSSGVRGVGPKYVTGELRVSCPLAYRRCLAMTRACTARLCAERASWSIGSRSSARSSSRAHVGLACSALLPLLRMDSGGPMSRLGSRTTGSPKISRGTSGKSPLRCPRHRLLSLEEVPESDPNSSSFKSSASRHLDADKD